MQGSEQLLAIAEVGVALAGFTGVIGALGLLLFVCMAASNFIALMSVIWKR